VDQECGIVKTEKPTFGVTIQGIEPMLVPVKPSKRNY
jgi:hypothetical protein